jgi:hypothetical protein
MTPGTKLELKVSTAGFQLFMHSANGLGKKLKSGQTLTDIESTYLSLLSSVRDNSRETAISIGTDHPWTFICNYIAECAENALKTLDNFTVTDHRMFLGFLVEIHSRCTGFSSWSDFMLGGQQNRTRAIVRSNPLQSVPMPEKLTEVLGTIEAFVTFVNGLKI